MGQGWRWWCLSNLPLLSWVLLRKKAMKWPRLWGKSCFSALHGSVLGFLVNTVWNSLLAEPPSSTFLPLRGTVGIGYSATESPGRSVTSLLPTLWAAWHPGLGGQGQSAWQQGQEEQGVSRSSWAPAQGASWESQASTSSKSPGTECAEHTCGLCHNAALFI